MWQRLEDTSKLNIVGTQNYISTKLPLRDLKILLQMLNIVFAFFRNRQFEKTERMR